MYCRSIVAALVLTVFAPVIANAATHIGARPAVHMELKFRGSTSIRCSAYDTDPNAEPRCETVPGIYTEHLFDARWQSLGVRNVTVGSTTPPTPTPVTPPPNPTPMPAPVLEVRTGYAYDAAEARVACTGGSLAIGGSCKVDPAGDEMTPPIYGQAESGAYSCSVAGQESVYLITIQATCAQAANVREVDLGELR